MRAIILAAGRGSRMGKMTDSQPKCRTVFQGKQLIEWQLEALRRSGINEIAIVRGYLSESFDFNLKYFDNTRWAETNMVESLVSARNWLESNHCVVSYSDIVYSADAVSRLIDFPGDIAITYDPNWRELWEIRFDSVLSDAETFKLNANSRIVEIGDRANTIDEINGQYMGLLRFSPVGWKKIALFLLNIPQTERDKLDITALIKTLIFENFEIYAVPINDRWYEVDTLSDLEKYEALINQLNGNLFSY